MDHLSTRPRLVFYDPESPTQQAFSMPLPVNPTYTPRRALHPPQTVRVPKSGTWFLQHVRSGGQGVKRGHVQGVKEGVRELKVMRQMTRDAERQRRREDGEWCVSFSL